MVRQTDMFAFSDSTSGPACISPMACRLPAPATNVFIIRGILLGVTVFGETASCQGVPLPREVRKCVQGW